MKSRFYVKSILPFTSFSDYASKMEKFIENDDNYKAIDAFWKKTIGNYYIIDEKFSGFNVEELYEENGVENFINQTKNYHDFFLRFYCICNCYYEAIKNLNTYVDNNGVNENYQVSLGQANFIRDCDKVYNEIIVRSPFIKLNVDLLNDIDRFNIGSYSLQQIIDILKLKDDVSKHYILFVDGDKTKSIDLTGLSTEIRTKLLSLEDVQLANFVKWIKGGKQMPINDSSAYQTDQNDQTEQTDDQTTDEPVEQTEEPAADDAVYDDSGEDTGDDTAGQVENYDEPSDEQAFEVTDDDYNEYSQQN